MLRRHLFVGAGCHNLSASSLAPRVRGRYGTLLVNNSPSWNRSWGSAQISTLLCSVLYKNSFASGWRFHIPVFASILLPFLSVLQDWFLQLFFLPFSLRCLLWKILHSMPKLLPPHLFSCCQSAYTPSSLARRAEWKNSAFRDLSKSFLFLPHKL